jgi:predicted PurR-regulated permease PerM
VQLLTPVVQFNKIQTVALCVSGQAAGIALLFFGRAFCITLVVSVILAFILEPLVAFFTRLRLPRPFASFLVCSMALFAVYLTALGLFTQVSSLAEDLPFYSQRVNQLVDSVAVRIERAEQNAYRLLVPKRFQEPEPQPEPPKEQPRRRRRAEPVLPQPTPPQVQEVRIRQERPALVNFLYSYISSFYTVLLMVSFVPFLVYFMLSWREHVHNSFLSMFEGSDRLIAGRSWHGMAEVARAYVVGNFLLGIILAVISCIIFWSWYLPYWILVGFISGFLSLVPYVGLPLAIIPPLFAALLTYTTVTPYVIIAGEVAALHLLALNLAYPAIVGARVHLNPLAVTLALMFWGTIWGGIGLVLAIPITAAMKAVFDNVEALKPYGALLGD